TITPEKTKKTITPEKPKKIKWSIELAEELAKQTTNSQLKQLLIKAGQLNNINTRADNLTQDTALLYASKLGLTNIAKSLIAAGANLNMRNKAGQTPLILASYSNDKEIVDALIAAGANLNLQNNVG